MVNKNVYSVNVYKKKLSCRRQTAWCFASLNISLNDSRSLKVIETTALRRDLSPY